MKLKENYKRGQAMLTAVVFFVLISSTVVFGIAIPILKQVRISHENYKSKQSLFLAQGSLEDILYRLKTNKQVSATENLSLDGVSVSSVTTNTATGKQIVATASSNNNIRKMYANVVLGTGASFNYGIQSGPGGFILENSARITGNVYSSGSVTGSGNTVYGDVVSAGPSGLVNNIHSTGSMYAHTIQSSDVDGNAFYVVKTSTSVDGVSYPNSPDQPVANMPISDEQISELEADALAGGVISSPCPYRISSDTTLGPIKINCDLEITGSPTVTLNGSVWVAGNISTENSTVIRVSASQGSKSVALIAHNPTNMTTSSTITLRNSSQFFGSGSVGSFIFLISQNNSAESGGNVEAISMENSTSGSVVLYASHGLITIDNNTTLKEVTGYKIQAKNSANIVYDTGLMSTLFTSGPGGGYEIINWFEGQ